MKQLLFPVLLLATFLQLQAQNVGIGTMTPGKRLDVLGSGGLRVSSTNGGSGSTDWIAGNFGGTAGDRVVLGIFYGNASVGAHNNALSAWADLSINPVAGNVGIGTTSPANKLSVNGNMDVNGRVGIGTGTPAVNLDIVGPTAIRMRVFSQDNSFAGYLSKNSTREFFAGVQEKAATPNASSGYHIVDNTAGAQRLVIDEVGRMGIGISTPGKKLDVLGPAGMRASSTNAGTGTIDWIAGDFGGAAGDRVVLGILNGTASIGAHNHALSGWADLSINPLGGNVGVGTAAPANKFSVNGNMDVNGRVGIGTGTPAVNLDVVGPTAVRMRVFSQDNSFAGYLSKNSTREFFAGVQEKAATPNASSGFHIFDYTAGAQRLVIDEAGRIGINSPTPAARLDVNGSFKLGATGAVLNSVIKFNTEIAITAVGASNSASISITPGIAGIVTGSTVYVSPSIALPAGISVGFARVSANGTVQVVFVNGTNAVVNIPAMTLYITVIN